LPLVDDNVRHPVLLAVGADVLLFLRDALTVKPFVLGVHGPPSEVSPDMASDLAGKRFLTDAALKKLVTFWEVTAITVTHKARSNKHPAASTIRR
jgi:hypothetical protein